MMKMGKRILSNRKGATAVEFALIAPIFFLLLFAIIDFGWYFFTQHTIQYATRAGTRLALVGMQLKDEEGNAMTREASIIKTIEDNAAVAVDPNELQINIFPVDPDYSDPDDPTTNAGSGGQIMRVRVSYTHTFFTPFIGKFFTEGKNEIRAEALYRNEGF